jgi:outer membrane biosynthesis protein TonB
MAKKEQKKPSKKPQTKGAPKAKKMGAKVKKTAAPAKKTAAPKKKATPKSAKAAKSFSVAEFADMTYLTEHGVMQWLKQGLLKGQQNARGDWQIEASNLQVPNVKRLVR